MQLYHRGLEKLDAYRRWSLTSKSKAARMVCPFGILNAVFPFFEGLL